MYIVHGLNVLYRVCSVLFRAYLNVDYLFDTTLMPDRIRDSYSRSIFTLKILALRVYLFRTYLYSYRRTALRILLPETNCIWFFRLIALKVFLSFSKNFFLLYRQKTPVCYFRGQRDLERNKMGSGSIFPAS